MADGRTLLFSSDRNGTYDMFRQPVDSTSAEPLVTGAGDQIAPRMTADGKWILYREDDAGQPGTAPLRSRIMRLPVAGGPARLVLESGATLGFRTPRSIAASPVFCEFKDGAAVFSTFDPMRGRGRELVREPLPQAPVWDLSPDGSTIAIGVVARDSRRAKSGSSGRPPRPSSATPRTDTPG
jgi:hypothetical protein